MGMTVVEKILARASGLKSVKAGDVVEVRLDPIIGGTNDEEIENIVMAAKNHGTRQIITSTYKAKPDNFKRLQTAFPAQAKELKSLYFENPHKVNGQFYLEEKLRLKLIKRCHAAALNAGLKFSSCREGFGQLNTATCDGSV